MHWEILDEKRREMLKKIARNITVEDYYMAGGTALSLQMGLRESVDFDFFVPQAFNTHSLLSKMRELYPELRILQHTEGTLDLDVDGVQVSFFRYVYPLLSDFVVDEELPELKMASPEDIAAMKMSAIGGGAKKDFYDLYQICVKKDFDAEKLYEILKEKFGIKSDFSYIIMGLSYFEDAEKETLVNVKENTDWEEIKKHFLKISDGMQESLEMELQDLDNDEEDFEL